MVTVVACYCARIALAFMHKGGRKPRPPLVHSGGSSVGAWMDAQSARESCTLTHKGRRLPQHNGIGPMQRGGEGALFPPASGARRPKMSIPAKLQVPTSPVPEARRLKRDEVRKGASLVANLGRGEEMLPCLILDSSQGGFRVRGSFRLRRRQVVELILDEYPLNAVRCSVIWVGKPGSKQEGEAGLQSVSS